MMNAVLTECLYTSRRDRYREIKVQTEAFVEQYCGSSIVRDNIYAVLENYARRNDLQLELLRYPFGDDELWAITFVKQGTVFVCINTDLPLCKQFFAVTHELYHIYCYVNNPDDSYIRGGSLLSAEIADEAGNTQEDLEANAFAGLVLMPERLLDEQMRLYGISSERLGTDAVLTLMDMFAMPYKAVVLRLYETGNIDRQQAETLLNASRNAIDTQMNLTGKARRWRLDGKGTEQFGSLLQMAAYCDAHDYLTDSRQEDDQAFIARLRQQYGLG